MRNVTLQSEFIPLTIEGLPALAAEKKAEGARFVQMLCVNTEEGIDLVYSFMKDGVLTNHEIKGVKKGTTVPSVTDQFLAAFVFENEAHDLFGVDIEGIAIDFGGNFYALAQKEPMTIISPEQKAAREKARKVAEAKAAKERAAKAAEASYVARSPSRQATSSSLRAPMIWTRAWPAWIPRRLPASRRPSPRRPRRRLRRSRRPSMRRSRTSTLRKQPR